MEQNSETTSLITKYKILKAEDRCINVTRYKILFSVLNKYLE